MQVIFQKVAFLLYSAIVLYFIVEYKNDIDALLVLNKICIGLGIFFAILSNILIRIVSKNTEKYTLPYGKIDKFLESLGIIFLSFSFSNFFFVLILMWVPVA